MLLTELCVAAIHYALTPAYIPALYAHCISFSVLLLRTGVLLCRLELACICLVTMLKILFDYLLPHCRTRLNTQSSIADSDAQKDEDQRAADVDKDLESARSEQRPTESTPGSPAVSACAKTVTTATPIVSPRPLADDRPSEPECDGVGPHVHSHAHAHVIHIVPLADIATPATPTSAFDLQLPRSPASASVSAVSTLNVPQPCDV